MKRSEQGGPLIVALVLAVALGAAGLAVGPAAAVPSIDPLRSAVRVGVPDQPFERRVSGVTKRALRQVRKWLRRGFRLVARAFRWWAKWFKRALFPIAIVIVAGLMDRGLVAAWRREGLRALLNYVPLMLYVYGRLFIASGVNLLVKALLVGAVFYGVIRHDVLPDWGLIPGRIDDIALIVFATRLFVFACPEDLVNDYAARAVAWRK